MVEGYQQETLIPISERIVMACRVTNHVSRIFPLQVTIWLAIKPRFIKAMADPLISRGPKDMPLLCLSQAINNVCIINGVSGRW
jgi:hypothetical protein